MDRRQNEMERLMLDYEKQCLKDLQKSYTEALADVKQRLRVLLSRQEETPTTSIAYQVQFQRQLEDQLQNALDTLKRGNVTSVNDFLNKTYEDSYLGTIYGIQGQGIPINIGIDHEQMARTINRKTDTFKFSERLYKNVDELGVAFKNQMSRGIANNFAYSKIAKQLAMESEASYKQAMRIVRTEGGRVKSEAKLNSMKAAKSEGADIVKQWDATFDGKTRAEHRFLDGQIKEIDEPFVDSQGREAQAPHKFGVASMDVNCRCIVVERARWAVEGEEMPNKVDNVTGELVEAKNYKEWKNKYQKQQAEQKKLPNNAKVFDKNSKSLPSVNDYFKTTSGDLVKIKEVNDYNGIKSVTLENGQTVVLGNTNTEALTQVIREYSPAKYQGDTADKMGIWGNIEKDPDKYNEYLKIGNTARNMEEQDGATRLGDRTLVELAKEQGFDKLPKKVSKEELDEIIEDGGIEIFRGLEDKKYCEQFLDGEYYAGIGQYGSGNYFVGSSSIQYDWKTGTRSEHTGLEMASGFAGNKENGGVIRGALRKDAKIIDWNLIDNADAGYFYNDRNIKKLMEKKNLMKDVVDWDGNIMRGEDGNALRTADMSNMTARVIYNTLTKDGGRWATFAGYDAIYVPSLNYYVVLNRSAVVCQTDIIKPLVE